MAPLPATTDYQRASSAVAMAFCSGRSLLSLRRSNQVACVDHHHNNNRNDEQQLDLFHSRLADHLSELHDAPLLSVSFIRVLLRSFLACESHFTNLLLLLSTPSSKSPSSPIACNNSSNYNDTDNRRTLSDLLDHLVKSLDMLNDLTRAIHSARQWSRHADIAAFALTTPTSAAPSNAQLARSKRALTKLLSTSSSSSSQNPNPAQIEGRTIERAWSFLSRNNSYATKEEGKARKMSTTWSAAKQLGAISASLAAPRVADCHEGWVAAEAACTMSWLVVFVMRVLAAAFSGTEFVAGTVPPKQAAWAVAMREVEEKVGEEWRRRRGRALRETAEVERCGKGAMEAVAAKRRDEEAAERLAELGDVGRRLEEGLRELEEEVRVVFRRIVRCREEVMRWLEREQSIC